MTSIQIIIRLYKNAIFANKTRSKNNFEFKMGVGISMKSKKTSS